MAEVLSSFTFKKGGSGRAVHDWERWCSGQIFKIGREDLGQASLRTFVVLLSRQAKKRGMKLRAHQCKEEDYCIIQTYRPEDEQQNGQQAAEQPSKKRKQPASKSKKRERGKAI